MSFHREDDLWHKRVMVILLSWDYFYANLEQQKIKIADPEQTHPTMKSFVDDPNDYVS
jgi:hypothetical protein